MARLLVLPSLAVVALGTTPATAADLDTLDLAQRGLSATIPMQWENEDERLGSYLFARGGVNLLDDVEVDRGDFSVGANKGLDGTGLPPDFATPFSRGTITDLVLRTGTGYDLELGLGLKVAEDITLELATGVQWNPIDSASGRLDYVTTEPDGLGGTNDVHWNSSVIGGDGEMWQVPITIALYYDAEIAEDLRLTVGGGGGIEWAHLSVKGLRSDRYAGAISLDPFTGNDVLVPLDFELEGESIALRYQLMLALSYELFPSGFLGGYVRSAGTSALNAGRFGFAENPNNLYREASDVEIGMLRNISVGATFSISF